MALVLMEGTTVVAERKMKFRSIEIDNDILNKSLFEFTQPADVKGTKLLSWLHKKDEKSQWIYLPSLNKSRRILASSQNSSFMGSEFTYDDIGGQNTSKYNYKLLSESKRGVDVIWKLEQTSKDSNIKDYQIITINKSFMNPEAVEYYNSKKELVKSSKIEDFTSYKVNGKNIFRPKKISMKNVQNNKESLFQWEKREFGTKQKESDFTAQALDVKK